jgi:hypothetical protein
VLQMMLCWSSSQQLEACCYIPPAMAVHKGIYARRPTTQLLSTADQAGGPRTECRACGGCPSRWIDRWTP